VTYTNTGSLPGWYYNQGLSLTTSAPSAFASDAFVCIYQTGLDGHYTGVAYDGSIAGAPGSGWFNTGPGGFPTEAEGNGFGAGAIPWYVIQPGQADSFSFQFYAGGAGTGACTNVAPALTNADEGGGATLTMANTFQDTPVG